MGGGAAASGENPRHTARVQARHVGRTDLVHHQDVRLLGFARGFNATQLRQHTPADVPQVSGTLGEQGVLQGFLLLCGSFNHTHPRRLRTLTELQTGIDFVSQLRVVEHFLVGNENLADGLGLGAFDQAFDIAAYLIQGVLQALAFNGGRLAAQRIVDGLQHLDMGRTNGDTRRGGHRLDQAAGFGGQQHGRDFGHRAFLRRTRRRQRLDFFAQALFDGCQQCRQRIGGDAWFSDELQNLTAAGAQAQQFAQALGRHGAVLAVDNAHADLAFEAFCQLRKDLRRTRVQAMGVGQADTSAGPVGGQLATEHLQHLAAAGGTAQFVAATFDQQCAESLEQCLVSFAETGEAEQATQGLAQITDGLVRCHEGQARTLDGLFAVQPPQAIAQRQRIDLLQYPGKAVTHAICLAQQTGATPHQFFEIVGRYAEPDHLRIQGQLLRRTLQQLQQGFGGAGTPQCLAQIGLAEGTGQQLQQAQVLIGLGRDADRQVDDLPVTPVHAVRELQQTNTGRVHQVAGLRRTVGDGDTLAKKSRTLGFAGLQAGEITFGHQAIGHQFVSEQLQRGGFIHGGLGHGYLLWIELEHAFSFLASGWRQVLF